VTLAEKNLFIAALVLLVLGKNLSDSSRDSAYLQKLISGGSKFSKEMQYGFRQSPSNFKLWGTAHKPCPTWVSWSVDAGSQKHIQKRLQNKIREVMKGFPAETIQKCVETELGFADMRPFPEWWRNQEAMYTYISASALKDIDTGTVTLHRSLVSHAIYGEKNARATLYNENLQEVCKFSRIDLLRNTAQADCKGLGKGQAIAEKRGDKMTFSVTTNDVVIFVVVDETIDRAKRKYPEIFK
jgi:hypothetical protein